MLIYYFKRGLLPVCLFVSLLVGCPVFGQAKKTTNPLIPSFNQPINFRAVTVADIKEATQTTIDNAKELLQRIYAIPDGRHSFKNTLEAYDNLVDRVAITYNSIVVLFNASADSTIRNEAQKSIQVFEKFSNERSLDEKIYHAYKDFAKSKEGQQLQGWRKKFLVESIENFERNGFALNEEKREELKAINNKISEAGQEFNNNINSYKDFLLVSEEDMKGLPQDYIKARKKEGDKYVITLDGPSYTTFMKYALSESARKALYVKYFNRAADKNLDVLKQLLIDRDQKAKLLGFTSYGAWQTASRMVKNTETVWNFENSLISKVKEKTQLDINELLEVKRRYLKDPAVTKINPWEASFYNNLLVKEKYDLDQEKLQEYLSLDNVMSGLFQTTEKLFGISYKEVPQASVWHKDVRTFDVLQGGKLIGRFYLDLFPRENKYTHAACFPIRKGKRYPQGYQVPVAALICNFNAPTENKPALLTHAQSVTFFHEFGHVLHNMLTRADLSSQSGTSTKRDFVEAPSQIFENWVWDYSVLKMFAKHYKTGEVLPNSMFDKMIASRNVGSGIATSAQISYGVLDMTLHDKYDPNGNKTTTEVVKEVTNAIMPYEYLEGTNFQAAFGHLVGYGASYYGYLWSKVYAEDMFSIFEKNGVLNPAIGKRYREIILAKGGSRDEYEMVKEFLGREPNQDAFLKSLGLNVEKNKTF